MSEKPLKVTELKLTKIRSERPKKKILRTIPPEPKLNVSAGTPVKNLAKTIFLCLQEHTYCEVSALYTEANIKALKAIVKATVMGAEANFDVRLRIGFVDPRPVSKNGALGTGFVYFLTTNLVRNADGIIVRTVF